MSLAESQPLRLVARAGHRGEAGHHLHDLVERRAMLIGPEQKALVAGDDQMRMLAAQFLRAKPLTVELAVAESFPETRGAGEQPVMVARSQAWRNRAPRCVCRG